MNHRIYSDVFYNFVRDCLLGKRNNNNKDINNNTNNHKAIISKERFKAKRDLDDRDSLIDTIL